MQKILKNRHFLENQDAAHGVFCLKLPIWFSVREELQLVEIAELARAMTKHGFHRGVRLYGDILRETRLAQGLRQVQLAKQAGVAERTVRKAESGQVIEKHIADYICTVLHLSLEDTMQAVATKRRKPSARMKARRIERDLQKAFHSHDIDPFLAWLHPEIQWRFIFSGEPSIYEAISGTQAALELVQRIRAWFERVGVCGRTEELTNIHSMGDILYIRSDIRLEIVNTTDDPGGGRRKAMRCWSAKILQFDDGLIRNLDHFLGAIPPVSAASHTSSDKVDAV